MYFVVSSVVILCQILWTPTETGIPGCKTASRRPNNITIYIYKQEMCFTAVFQEGKVDTEIFSDLVQAFLKIWDWFP